MMNRRKILHDLGSRNTTKVLQEAGDSTFVAKWTKSLTIQTEIGKKNEKVLEMDRPRSKSNSD